MTRVAAPIVLAACAATPLVAAAQATTPIVAEWLNPASGSWTDAAKWSSAPYYPSNDNPTGISYDARIAATGAPYTVTVPIDTPAPIPVNSVSIASPDATLVEWNGSLNVASSIDLNAGTLRLEGSYTLASISNLHRTGGTLVSAGSLDLGGGTLDTLVTGPVTALRSIRNGTIRGPAQSLTIGPSWDTPYLDNVTLATDVTAVGASQLYHQIKFDGATYVSNGGTFDSVLLNDVTLSGTGTLVCARNLDLQVSTPSNRMTFPAGITVVQGTGSSASPNTVRGATVLNETKWCVRGAGGYASVGVLENRGLINVGPGVRLESYPVNDSRIVLGEGAVMYVPRVPGGFQNIGTIDMSGGGMMFEWYSLTDPGLAQLIDGQLVSGYHGGAWDGPGISSGLAAAIAADPNQSHKTAVGYAESNAVHNWTMFGVQTTRATTAMVRYTYNGDANLDGAVDLTDFTILAANFNGTQRQWYHGDFNYDGKVDLTDFTLLASNFNEVMPDAAATGTSVGATVPEPNALAALLAASLVLVAPVRRSRQPNHV